MKNLLNLKGVQILNSKDQKTILGGKSGSRCSTGVAALCNGLSNGDCCGDNGRTCRHGCCTGPVKCDPHFK